MAFLDQSSAKSPLSYILRYFPAVADALGNAPTDESALTELARWLMHWHVRNNKPTHTPHYTLPGKMRERLSEAPNAGQFLQACELLHDSLTERLAIEPTARQLLGVAFSTENWQAVRDALKWWAGWIRAESELAHPVRTGADVYLEALERIPITIRKVGNIPQYVVTTSSDFDKEMRPLWEGFRVAIRALGFGEQQSLCNQLNGLRGIDREKLKRQREQFEQNEQYAYPLEWLHDEYQPFRFEIAGHPDGFQDGRPVGATFWADLSVLVLLKQGAVQSALTVLNADSHGALPPPAPTAAQDADATPAQLTLPQLALFHILSGEHIRDEAHANQLATTVGKISGERLLKCFNKWRKTSDRTCIEGRAKLRPFIKNMEAVIPHLTKRDKKEAAESELEGLKRNLAASLD